MATEIIRSSPVMALMQEAKASAVATDHMGKVKAVMPPAMALAARPYLSPISPEMVTIIFLRSGPMSSTAIISTWDISATPYQMAERPLRYEVSKIAMNVDPENRPVMQKATVQRLKERPPTKKSSPAAAFLRATMLKVISTAV